MRAPRATAVQHNKWKDVMKSAGKGCGHRAQGFDQGFRDWSVLAFGREGYLGGYFFGVLRAHDRVRKELDDEGFFFSGEGIFRESNTAPFASRATTLGAWTRQSDDRPLHPSKPNLHNEIFHLILLVISLLTLLKACECHHATTPLPIVDPR